MTYANFVVCHFWGLNSFSSDNQELNYNHLIISKLAFLYADFQQVRDLAVFCTIPVLLRPHL